jgi:ParB/RepB/Spo0J family partition protein
MIADAQLAVLSLKDIILSSSNAQAARRKRFKKAELVELANSIKSHGVLQPIVVRPLPKGKAPYELVAGERRYTGSEIAGLDLIPCVVRHLTDEQVLEVQLIENLQRADLHPMEEAEGYQELMKKHGHPIEQLHAQVGKSKSYVYGRIKLLALCKKVRDAFYDGTINASVALLLARIPSEALQVKALEDVQDGDYGQPMSHSEAQVHLQNHYMLRLADAPFPCADPKLNGAGPCAACPKRTGNQPELFGDVKGADICTDPVCFNGKAVAYGQRAVAEAKAKGQQVITGKAAEAIVPYGIDSPRNGWVRLDAKNHNDRKNRTNRQILGKDAEPVLLQEPKTGRVVELVKESLVQAQLPKVKASGGDNDYRVQAARERKKAELENRFRLELYTRIREKLPTPSLTRCALEMWDRMEHDAKVLLCKARGFEPPLRKRMYGSKVRAYDEVAKGLATWTAAEIAQFINDCLYCRELTVSGWQKTKPTKLLEAAKAAGVNAEKVRKEITDAAAAKKKPKAKTKGKGK